MAWTPAGLGFPKRMDLPGSLGRIKQDQVCECLRMVPGPLTMDLCRPSGKQMFPSGRV